MLLATFVGLIFIVRAVTLNVPTLHVDGAFQTASGLFRLDSGQFPGRDFLPYLGLAAVYVPFPVFKAAGSDLAASATAAYVVVMAASAATIVLSIRLVTPTLPSARVFIVALITMPLALGAAKSGYLYEAFEETLLGQIVPGNSMRSLRSSAPYLSAALLLVVLDKVRTPAKRNLCFGAIGGGIFWWSSDYGPPAAAMAAVTMGVDLVRARGFSVANIAAGAVGAIATMVATVTLLTAFHPRRFMEYLFVDVGRDQWWYFGPWFDARIFAMTDLSVLLTSSHLFAVTVFAALGVRVAHGRDRHEAMLALIGLALITGGLLATVGGHVDIGYFAAFRWWAGLVVLAHAIRWLWSWLEPKQLGTWVRRYSKRVLAGVALTYAASGAAAYAWRQDQLARDPAFYREDGLGGYLPVGWRAYMTRAKSSGSDVVEEYWGLWSAVSRQHFGAVDSTIHALGDERVAHGQSIEMKRPLMISSRPSTTLGYQGWSMSVNWWFYAPLLRNHRIVAVSPKTFLWTRAEQPGWKPVPCRVSSDRTRLIVEGASGGLFDVHATYRTEPAARRLLMAYNGLGMADGWFPLDAAAGHARFPVFVDAEVVARGVRFRVSPAAGPRAVAVTGCTAAAVPMTPDVRAILPQALNGTSPSKDSS